MRDVRVVRATSVRTRGIALISSNVNFNFLFEQSRSDSVLAQPQDLQQTILTDRNGARLSSRRDVIDGEGIDGSIHSHNAYPVTTTSTLFVELTMDCSFSHLFAILPEMPKIFCLGGSHAALSQTTPRYPEIAKRMNYGRYSFPKPW